MKSSGTFIIKQTKRNAISGGEDMDYLVLFLVLLFIVFRAPILLILALLFLVLLATGVFVFLICKGILWSFANTLKMAVEHTAWGFILPWTVLCVLAADLRASLKKAP